MNNVPESIFYFFVGEVVSLIFAIILKDDKKKMFGVLLLGTMVSGIIALVVNLLGSSTAHYQDPPKGEIVVALTNEQTTEISDSKGVQMVLVPKGEFTMGTGSPGSDEYPPHQVYLDTFYIDKYEVTNGLYKVCVEDGVCNQPSDTRYYEDSQYAEYPVVYVDWFMAATYCEWRGARLPSEAEWEKAAHGTYRTLYPWGDRIDSTYANYNENIGDITPVGSFPNGVSPYGAYDMAGNVWEWVADWYDIYPGGNATGSDFGQTYRVLRGGAWYTDEVQLRSAYRTRTYPGDTAPVFGFRCSRPPWS